ncbi:MAG: amidohydrolase [Desulfobulbaceae bacterium]|nr:MAG: amidohydrolase [Desulfobulbaceae bacterium]
MAILHRAPWVLPISAPPVVDGAVMVENGMIVAVGPYRHLRHGKHARLVEHEGRILLPALLNCHCHLELSGCAAMTDREVAPAHMPAWITELLALRASRSGEDDTSLACAVLARQHADGVALLVDIGNGLRPAASCHDMTRVDYYTELLGLSRQATLLALQVMQDHDDGHNFTCHAPYSTSAALLQAVKERAALLRRLYPLHVGESLDEVEFLATGHGPFRSFLEERGVWDGSFAVPGCGPVAYLERLGLLDELTLCVHCLHLDEAEIDLLARRRAGVCLCAGSNRFLGVGRAPLAEMLAVGLKPCLGTDSLASNPRLSLWREMNILADDHPQLDPALILAMATWNGAEIVARSELGRLAPGGSAHFIAVAYEGSSPLEFLVREPHVKDVYWV